MNIDHQHLLKVLPTLSHAEKAELLAMLDEVEERRFVQSARDHFVAFIKAVEPVLDAPYKLGTHLKRLIALLEDVEAGAKDRIAVSIAPRFGKSQTISILYPAWYLGKHPEHKVIVASHTADLAVDMARKVRNLMQTKEYRRIFPDVSVAADAKAAGKWNTNRGGEFYATGVGGALAGRGGHLIIVDDPHSEQDLRAGNFEALDSAYDWFRIGLRTRLMPGGKLAILHCLVGSTGVRLASGEDKPIRDIRPGDTVVGYAAGGFVPARVLGWSNQGSDHVFTVRLKSGNLICGNGRHPLLINDGGVERWVTISSLQRGMHLVSTTGAQTPHTASKSEVCVRAATTKSTTASVLKGGLLSHEVSRCFRALQKGVVASLKALLSVGFAQTASPATTTVSDTQRLFSTRSGTMGSGKGKSALLRGATNQCETEDSALDAVTRLGIKNVEPKVRTTALQNVTSTTSSPVMESVKRSTTACTRSKRESVQYVGSLRIPEIPPQSGKSDASRWTTATARVKYGLSCVMRAISSLKIGIQSRYYAKQLRMLSTTLDEVVEIAYSGEEDVFDIQVEGTENFLANGVVSHNTRWSQKDLIGRLTKEMVLTPEADQYEVFEFPALLADADGNEKSLWPEQWSTEALLRTRASMAPWMWNANYMQNPTARDSAIIKADWIKWWEDDEPPQLQYLVQAWDTALTTKERSDYSVCHTWGVFFDENTNLHNAILINRVKGKYEFPELKQLAHAQYADWEPDSVIVEAKASGQPLIDEMRRSGIFVQDFSPGKGQDKIARLNAVADMFASGQVWFPRRRWAEEVVDEILAFPAGEHDDEVDATTLALMRIRKGGLLRLATDQIEDSDPHWARPKRSYY